MKVIELEIPGVPVPQGGMRAFARGNKAFVTHKNPKELGDYRARVTLAANEVMGDLPPLHGPVAIDVNFYMPRPQSHFGSGRNEGVIRAGAPSHPAVKPDLDRLARSFLDAITFVVIVDDNRVVQLAAAKHYSDKPRTEARIEPLPLTVGAS